MFKKNNKYKLISLEQNSKILSFDLSGILQMVSN